MKLIKCGHCGRPYYDENEACPYCGHALGSSPTNYQKEGTQKQPEQTNQEPASSKKTDPAPEQKTIIAAAPIPEPEPTKEDKPILEPEPQGEAEIVAKPTPAPLQQPKQNTQRANAMAAISASATQNAELQNSDRNESDPNQIETILPPRKRHTWLWVLLVVLIMLAAAAYFFRDYVKQALSSLLS